MQGMLDETDPLNALFADYSLGSPLIAAFEIGLYFLQYIPSHSSMEMILKDS